VPVSADPAGTVYLLHFDRPFGHARHYIGWTRRLEKRLEHHRRGTGARLLALVREAGIGWTLARTWEGDRALEKRLSATSGVPRCPICTPGAGKGRGWRRKAP
jgi:predicted GIY-YIG superfamily endonuclease